MPSNEKELNCILFDQLAIIDRISSALEEGGEERAKSIIASEREYIMRKLYQNPQYLGMENPQQLNN